ncbi:MAG TPA: hypothetical protein V6C69_07940 [Trichormus sp.]|jgi:hypothetical protein
MITSADDDDDLGGTAEELARWQETKAIELARGLAMVGKRFETAIMRDSGSLMMSSLSALPSGQITNANWDVPQDDPLYGAICQRFNLQKPGDLRSIEYRRVDDKWLNIITNQFEEPY